MEEPDLPVARGQARLGGTIPFQPDSSGLDVAFQMKAAPKVIGNSEL